MVNINLLAANTLGKIPKLVGYYLLSESGANPFVPIGNPTLDRDKEIFDEPNFFTFSFFIVLCFGLTFNLKNVKKKCLKKWMFPQNISLGGG